MPPFAAADGFSLPALPCLCHAIPLCRFITSFSRHAMTFTFSCCHWWLAITTMLPYADTLHILFSLDSIFIRYAYDIFAAASLYFAFRCCWCFLHAALRLRSHSLPRCWLPYIWYTSDAGHWLSPIRRWLMLFYDAATPPDTPADADGRRCRHWCRHTPLAAAAFADATWCHIRLRFSRFFLSPDDIAITLCFASFRCRLSAADLIFS